MNVHPRPTTQPRIQWPDAPATIDPDTMHPRALEMAERMREGVVTYRDLRGMGFSDGEIRRFSADARAHAEALADRQVMPGADLLSEMAEKARAAIPMQPPLPPGVATTQAALVAWRDYCAAVETLREPRAVQRERCLKLLQGWFRNHAPKTGASLVRHVVGEAETMLNRTRAEWLT